MQDFAIANSIKLKDMSQLHLEDYNARIKKQEDEKKKLARQERFKSRVSHDFAASKVQQQNEVSVVLSTIERIRLNKSLLVKSYEKAVLLPNSLNDEDGYIYHSEKNKDCQIGCH